MKGLIDKLKSLFGSKPQQTGTDVLGHVCVCGKEGCDCGGKSEVTASEAPAAPVEESVAEMPTEKPAPGPTPVE